MSDDFDAYMDALSTTYGLAEGHTLTAADVAAIALVDAHHREEEERLTDCFHRGYQAGLAKAGGTDVQALSNKIDEVTSRLAVEGAMRQMERQWGFREGAAAMREMLARFVEQGGDAVTAASLRANWNPTWREDPGPPGEHDDSPAFPQGAR